MLNGDGPMVLRARWQRNAEARRQGNPKLVAKWEGAALLINTQISGPPDYTVMERWERARSRAAR